MEYKLLD